MPTCKVASIGARSNRTVWVVRFTKGVVQCLYWAKRSDCSTGFVRWTSKGHFHNYFWLHSLIKLKMSQYMSNLLICRQRKPAMMRHNWSTRTSAQHSNMGFHQQQVGVLELIVWRWCSLTVTTSKYNLIIMKKHTKIAFRKLIKWYKWILIKCF